MVLVFWNRGSLNRWVNLCYVLPIPDGDAKRHKVYTGSGNGALRPVRECSCIPCTGVLVVGGLQAKREREFVPGLCGEKCGLQGEAHCPCECS